jgi:UDP-hydrolysing UDP-N-acetyl-D-glucosamine 2-epimerase
VREVLLVTGGRADWGLLKSPARLLRDDPRFALRLLATGAHLDPALGETVREIEDEGFAVAHRVPILQGSADDAAAATAAMARATEGVGHVLAAAPPDLTLVLGDRYEILAAVSAALLARVPVAHIAGGDVTEGAVDDSIRHAITKMSHLHFVTNAQAAERVAQLGEDPARIHVVGSPGLDGLTERAQVPPAELRADLGLPAEGPLLLVTFHPPTLDETPGLRQFAELTAALDALGPGVALLFTGSNADPEGRRLTEAARAHAEARPNAAFRDSLGHARYFAALAAAAAVVGNSSSGLYEAPSFGIPTVNVGSRQDGRLRAESVIDVAPEKAAILQALRRALETDASGAVNPYGDGRAGERIVEVLAGLEAPRTLLRKRFHRFGGAG